MLIIDEQIMLEHIKIINLLTDQELFNLLQLLGLYATTPEGHYLEPVLHKRNQHS